MRQRFNLFSLSFILWCSSSHSHFRSKKFRGLPFVVVRNFGLVCPITVHIHRSAVQRDRKSEVTNAYSHPYTQPYQFDVYSYSRIRIKCLEVKLVVNFGTTHTHTHSLTHMCVSLVRLIQSAKRERSNYMCAPHLTLTRSLDGFAI